MTRAERRHHRQRVIARRLRVARLHFKFELTWSGRPVMEDWIRKSYGPNGGALAKWNFAHGCSRHG